jgi:hypothetical protein
VVFTFLWGPFSRLGLTFLAGLWFLVRCRPCRVQGVPGWLLCVLAACSRACLRCLAGGDRGDGAGIGVRGGAMAALW